MDIYQPDRKSSGRARERVAARQAKRQGPAMATRSVPDPGRPVDARPAMQRSTVSTGYAAPPRQPAPRRRAARSAAAVGIVGVFAALGQRVWGFFRDVLWYIRTDIRIALGLITAVAFAIVAFLAVNLLSGRVFPNVWALGVGLGGMTVDQAASALNDAWANDVRILLTDGERDFEMAPVELGIRLDALATATDARRVGLAGIPLGFGVTPTVELDMLTAQTALLNLSPQTDVAPYNAGYRWDGERLVGMPGANGRYLDVAMTLQALQEDLAEVVTTGRLEMVMTFASPDVLDPAPYLAEAQALTQQTFFLRGYDPFTNETLVWMPDRDTFTSWLEAGEESLSLRAVPFAAYLDQQIQALDGGAGFRYLEPQDAINQVRTAIESGSHEAYLRLHYRNSIHTVDAGDSGYRIARRNGVSFYLLQQANPNRDWDVPLSIGEEIVVPSRDSMLPLPVVPNKRIIVDLETQQLWAYENGQLVFNWLISSGMDHAPTSPGVYQILSHAEVAEGSSIELCGDTSCGTWTMYWFMGIYEAIPGLVNGFHGAVLLPGGTYMGNGTVGRQWTYGCIMSVDDQAEQLYRWADEGTVVEIISREYAPQSDLGRQSLQASLAGRVA